jgi:hypothetical protein
MALELVQLQAIDHVGQLRHACTRLLNAYYKASDDEKEEIADAIIAFNNNLGERFVFPIPLIFVWWPCHPFLHDMPPDFPDFSGIEDLVSRIERRPH